MNRLIFVIMSILILLTGCKKEEKKENFSKKEEQKEDWEYFGGGSYTEWIKGDKNDPEGEYISYHINVDSDKKEIDFYRVDPKELATETDGRGIKWDKYVVDKTNKTISFYRKRDGALIITVKFISDTEFKIIEYGKWLDPKSPDPDDEITPNMSEEEKEKLKEERRVKTRFIWGDFYDTNRIYRTD